MRLLIAAWEFPPIVGGIGVFLRSIAVSMADRGHQIMMLLPGHVARRTDVRHENMAFRSFFAPRRGVADCVAQGVGLVRASAGWRPDFIIPGGDEDSIVAAGLFHAMIRGPIVPLYHGSEILRSRYTAGIKSRIKVMVMARLGQVSAGAIVNSEYTRSLLKGSGWLNDRPVFKLPCGIDDAVIQRGIDTKPGIRALQQYSSRVPLLLSIGRLVPRKGHDVALRAVALLKKNGLRTRYVIAGDGSHRSTLERLASALGIAADVVFTGYVSDDEKYSLLDLSDVFVLPSREEGFDVEGFGIAFLEAAARGKPSIGGRHGGVGEAIVHGVTGLLADPHRPEDVAEKIREIVSNPFLMRKMGAAGRQRCIDSMAWSIRAAQLEDILEGLRERSRLGCGCTNVRHAS